MRTFRVSPGQDCVRPWRSGMKLGRIFPRCTIRRTTTGGTRMDAGPLPEPRAPRTPWRPEGCERLALVLQGGGALGAYQAGVYQALHEAGLEPDFVAGVSIGGINGAIIAGNPPERRLERLRDFWETITARPFTQWAPDGDVAHKAFNIWSSLLTAVLGQPAFFRPYLISPWISPRGSKTATAFYDT